MKSYDEMQRKIHSDIDREGWSAMGILVGEDSPPFNYSIGLAMMGLPELLVVGLPTTMAHILMHDAVKQMKSMQGDIPDKYITDKLANLPIAYCDIDPVKACKLYMVQTENYYLRVPASVTQMVWPDTNGILPFQPGCDRRMAQLQSGVRDYVSEAS